MSSYATDESQGSDSYHEQTQRERSVSVSSGEFHSLPSQRSSSADTQAIVGQDLPTLGEGRSRGNPRYQERHESSIERSSPPPTIGIDELSDSEEEEVDESEDEDSASDEWLQQADFAQLASQLRETGCLPLLDAAVDANMKAGHPYFKGTDQDKKMQRYAFRRDNVMTVCSMDKAVLREICGGNLAKAAISAEEDSPLRGYLQRLWDRSERQPSIYIRILADSNGDPLSGTEIEHVVDILEKYMSRQAEHWEIAYKIDSEYNEYWTEELSQRGKRSFLETSTGDRSRFRYKRLRKFLSAVKRRLENNPSREEPFSHPFSYVGYSINAIKRQAQHSKHTSKGNYIMSLVYLASRLLLPKTDWKLHSFIICMLCELPQATAAEMFCTRVSGAYSTDGTGFCIAPAGLSTRSAEILTSMSWDSFYEWVTNNTRVNQGLIEEDELTAAFRERTLDQKHDEVVAALGEHHRTHQDFQRDLEQLLEEARENKDSPETYQRVQACQQKVATIERNAQRLL